MGAAYVAGWKIDAVSAVLSEPGYRTAAGRIRDEIAGLPGPEHVLTLLERLATQASD